MLMGEVGRWMGPDTVSDLLPAADRALQWMSADGDQDGDGFIEVARTSDRGLVNQGWKDSPTAICFASGAPASPPVALAEVQGYAYAAYRARAALADAAGRPGEAREWIVRADELKAAFNARFWLSERGWFAVGLDRDKRPIDSLTSNIGHCLWSGIVDRDKATAVADALTSDQMFTGWGIRTLASTMDRYNPMSYHNGSVWPHDTAICAAGLMEYGFVDQAQHIAEALLGAAPFFDYRLPELFCGYGRRDFPRPVPYPAACSPQAWASAAPLLLLRSMLELRPDVPSGVVRCAPQVPDRWLPVRVSGITIDTNKVQIDVKGTEWALSGLVDGRLSLLTGDGGGR